MNRSWLFVPADSERKLQKAAGTAADALILDLEDSVAAESRPAARALARDFLQDRPEAWVRINPVASDDATADLEAVIPAGPAGIVLPKPRSVADAVTLSGWLDARERDLELEAGETQILPVCTEHPAALFALGEYAGATPRLAGLTWGAEDLGAAVGATANRDADGSWLPLFEFARSLCLLAAAAAEVPAIDTVFTDFRNLEALADYAGKARREGFTGMLAIHPDQVGVINAAFQPTAEEVERARRIVALFNDNPGAGTLGLDDEMVDRPHLLQARRILAIADKTAQ